MTWKRLINGVKNVLPIFQLLASLAALFGIIFASVQLNDYRLKQSAEVAMRFGEYLDEEPYLSISQVLDTADSNTKIFQPEGRFTVGDVDRYLGTFETLGNLYQNGLITHEMLNNNFSYYIEKTYANAEIRAYVEENPSWWPNFIYLSELFKQKYSSHK